MPSPITFIHAPKCGGTSMGSALRLRYFYSQATIPLNESADIRKRLWPDVAGVDKYYKEHEIRDVLMAQYLRRGIRCISAHIRYNARIHESVGDGRRYVTILREPVSRFVSHFAYLGRRHPEARAADDFDALLETEQARRHGSVYLFFFAGRYQVDESDVDRLVGTATENLRRFDLVGDTGHMDRFQSRVERLIGAKLYRLDRNRGDEGSKPKLSAAQLDRVRLLCAPDIAIYDYARTHLMDA